MKKILVFCVSFLLTQTAFSQKDSLYVGWGITLDGLSKSKMFLTDGQPYYDVRQRIITQYRVTISQPTQDGVVIIPIKSKKAGKLFYGIFCRIWAWEYVGTVPSLPIVVKFSDMGNITVRCANGLKTFQRIVYVAYPGLVSWQQVFLENPPRL